MIEHLPSPAEWRRRVTTIEKHMPTYAALRRGALEDHLVVAEWSLPADWNPGPAPDANDESLAAHPFAMLLGCPVRFEGDRIIAHLNDGSSRDAPPPLAIAEFIAARLGDDEERASFVHAQQVGQWQTSELWRLSWQDEYDLLCIEPGRALATVASMREVLTEHTPVHVATRNDGLDWNYTCCSTCAPPDNLPAGSDYWPCLTLRAVAAQWHTHPDFRPEWAL